VLRHHTKVPALHSALVHGDDVEVTDDAAARAAELLALVVEPDRLLVVAALTLGARTVAEVAERTGLDVRRTGRALARLENAGIVTSEDGEYRVDVESLRDVARRAQPVRQPDDHGAVDPGEAAVLRVFIRDGRLTQIPAAHGKRLVVLDHIVRIFEPGVRYSEREVNALLRAFHPDTAALRRYLVDEELLARDAGLYWRSGGTVVLD
jgi:hypothetical protein